MDTRSYVLPPSNKNSWYLGVMCTSESSFDFPLLLQTIDMRRSYPIHVLIDSGASGNFIGQSLVNNLQLTTERLNEPITVQNADGTPSQGGPIDSHCEVIISAPPSSFHDRLHLEVALIGNYDVILGLPWLKKHNPMVDWKAGTLDIFRDTTPLSTTSGIFSLEEDIRPEVYEDMISSFGLDFERQKAFDIFRDPFPDQLLYEMSGRDHLRPTTAEEDMKVFIPQEYWEYNDVFIKTNFDELPEHSEFDHTINFKDSFKPQQGKLYHLSPREDEALDKFWDKNLKSNRIRPSKSSQAALFFFINKHEEINAPGQDPGLRPIQDYRYLNVHTIRDRYLLPLLSEILQSLKFQTAKYFTVIDIRLGHNNVQIKEGDEWKAAFITKRGLFEPLVMFFGLCNAPASLQQMINVKFNKVLDSGCVFIYMDDIIILGDTLEELRLWTKQVLNTMRKHKLSCKPVKCQFKKETVKYLGTIISHGQLSVNPSKVKAIADGPVPRKLCDVQSFLGSMNFWRKFIPKFSHIARPLNDLLRHDRIFEWTSAHQDAFDTLKTALTTQPVLKAPQRNLPFYLEMDSSGFAISGILMQKHDNRFHPVGFYSCSLSPVEHNYPTLDQELLAIIKSLTHWRHFSEGAEHTVIIRSDNSALSYFMMNHNLSRRQARWSAYLSRFDFRIEHILGKSDKADGLSRRPDYFPGTIDNADQVLLPPSLFINSIIEFSFSSDLQECLKFPNLLPPDIAKKLSDPSSRWTRIDGLVQDDGERLVVPEDVSLQTDIILSAHSPPHAGHPGIEMTCEILSRDYYWNAL